VLGTDTLSKWCIIHDEGIPHFMPFYRAANCNGNITKPGAVLESLKISDIL
jgi:hypothetical protein